MTADDVRPMKWTAFPISTEAGRQLNDYLAGGWSDYIAAIENEAREQERASSAVVVQYDKGEPVGVYATFDHPDVALAQRHAILVEVARDVLGAVDQDVDYCFSCHIKRPCEHDVLREVLEGEPT